MLARDLAIDTRPDARPPTLPLPTVRLAPTAADADMTTPLSQSAVISSGSTEEEKRVDGEARREETAAPRAPRSCCRYDKWRGAATLKTKKVSRDITCASAASCNGPSQEESADSEVTWRSATDGTESAPPASEMHIPGLPDASVPTEGNPRTRPFAAIARSRDSPEPPKDCVGACTRIN